jgi:PBP1b-binding outer membrane lipoprotein LpoB
MKQKKIWITLAASALIITGCSSGHENDKSKDNKAEQTANQRNSITIAFNLASFTYLINWSILSPCVELLVT